MKTMKKILAFALAGVMALALLTGCGTGGSASHKSIAKAMADYDNGHERKTAITYTPLLSWTPSCNSWQRSPDLKLLSRRFTTATTPFSREFAPTSPVPSPTLIRSSTSTAASTTRTPESRPST